MIRIKAIKFLKQLLKQSRGQAEIAFTITYKSGKDDRVFLVFKFLKFYFQKLGDHF